MEFSQLSDEQLIADYERQEKMVDAWNKELWATDAPVSSDWHETMGRRDGAIQIMDEIESELSKRSIHKNSDGIWTHDAYNKDRQSRMFGVDIDAHKTDE